MWPLKKGIEVTSGTKFNSWELLEEVSINNRKDKREREFKCRCECGHEENVNYKNLKYNKSKSCVRCRLQKSIDACTFKWEPIEIDEITLKIPLSNSDLFALIDKDDFDRIKDYTWCYCRGYAMAGYKDHYSMHQLLNNTPKNFCTDHINENKLDNRKSNLRSMSRSEHIKRHLDYIKSFDTHKRPKRGCKIPIDKKEEIIKLYSDGKTQNFLAQLFNVSSTTIHRIINKRI